MPIYTSAGSLPKRSLSIAILRDAIGDEELVILLEKYRKARNSRAGACECKHTCNNHSS